MYKHLRNRETKTSASPLTSTFQKQSYRWIVPNETIFDLKTPSSLSFKKFSPDGKYLIAFGDCYQTLSILEYQGYRALESTVIVSSFNNTTAATITASTSSITTNMTVSHNGNNDETIDSNSNNNIILSHHSTNLGNLATVNLESTDNSSNSETESSENDYDFEEEDGEDGNQTLMDDHHEPTYSNTKVNSHLHKNIISNEVLFDKLFKPKHKIPIIESEEYFCRDFVLFCFDLQYIILASASTCKNPPFIAQTCHIQDLYDLTLWSIHLESGEIRDKLHFNNEFMGAGSSFSAASMYENMLCLASIEFQCLYLIAIMNNGKLIKGQSIGFHIHADDEIVLNHHDYEEKRFLKKRKLDSNVSAQRNQDTMNEFPDFNRSTSSLPFESFSFRFPFEDSCFPSGKPLMNGLKQKILSFLYKQQIFYEKSTFHRIRQCIDSMLLWKAHFLDKHILLIKLSSAENVLMKASETASYNTLYVLFDLETCNVVEVMDNSSEEILQLFQDYDALHTFYYKNLVNTKTVPTNNSHSRNNLLSMLRAIRKAKNGGVIQAIRRVNSYIPVNAQAVSDSPYFDHNLFSYDERSISYVDRPRISAEFPVKFFDRQSNRFLFSVTSNADDFTVNEKRLAVFIFHPHDPLVISIQTSYEGCTNINLHIYQN